MRLIIRIFKKLASVLGFGDLTFNYTKLLKVNQVTFRVPVKRSVGLSHFSLHEIELNEVYTKLLETNEGCSFIDIGFNLGQTFLKIKSIKPEIEYIGFDPSPYCTDYCRELARVNAITKCSFTCVGVSDNSKIQKFYYQAEFSHGASLLDNVRSFDKQLSSYIPVVKLNQELISNYTANDNFIIKIDVEGAERFVLEGLRDLIENLRPLIVCEFLCVYSTVTKDINQDSLDVRLRNQIYVEKFLQSIDYDKYRINENISLSRIETIGINDNTHLTNYILIPKERLKDITSFKIQ